MSETQKATLLLEQIHCITQKGRSLSSDDLSKDSSDDVYMKIFVDGNFDQRWPKDGEVDMDTGDNKLVDLDITVEYGSTVTVEVWEHDHVGDDDILGIIVFERELYPDYDQVFDGSNEKYGEGGTDDAKYALIYRIIKEPIRTVRVYGIKCRKPSLGIDMDVVNAIAGALEMCANAASSVIGKSKRPRAQAISSAFDAVSNVLEHVPELTWFLAQVADNPDEVYMKHVTASKAIDGGFFPENEDYYQMNEGDEVYFEDQCGHYFRFPFDRDSVRIQLREHDPIKGDISLGSLTINVDDYDTLKEEGAQVLVANEFSPDDPHGDREGEGAIYYICFDVGIENWAKPATNEAQETDPVAETSESSLQPA